MFSDFIRRKKLISLFMICLGHTPTSPPSQHTDTFMQKSLLFVSSERQLQSLRAALFTCSSGGFLTGTFPYFSHVKTALPF